jgi:hypothetical protein
MNPIVTKLAKKLVSSLYSKTKFFVPCTTVTRTDLFKGDEEEAYRVIRRVASGQLCSTDHYKNLIKEQKSDQTARKHIMTGK